MQSYELTYADVGLATSGSQNISFSFASNELVQRIDRKFTPSGEREQLSQLLASLDMF